MIPIYKPYLPPDSLRYAHEALDSTWISSQGKYIRMVQDKLQELLNVKYVIPLNNGTSACHLVAKALHRTSPETVCKKRILVPDNVYVAAWNAFLFDKDYELIPVKTDLDTWNYDLNDLDARLQMWPDAAVLIVHNIGNIINVPALQRKYPDTHFVEDNCEGFMGQYEGQLTGTASFASAISFFGNKNITSGEGGAFVTNSEETYLYVKCIQSQGQSSKRFVHDELGYNYRITNIQSAILYGQLELLPTIVDMKNHIFDSYRNAFKDREDVKIQSIAENTVPGNWMFGVRIPGCEDYDKTDSYFKAQGIEIRPMFYSINEHKHLRTHPDIFGCDDTNAKLLNKECFILPSFPELKDEEVNHIIKSVNDYVSSRSV